MIGRALFFVSLVAAVAGCGDAGNSQSNTSTGGSTGTGGANAGGDTATGGNSAGGEGGVYDPPDPTPTSGCNAATWPASGPYTIDVAGLQREYIVTVPDGYDGTQPMKLIFVYHGLTGTAEQTAGNGFWGYFGLANVDDGSAIFVAPQGLPLTEGDVDYAWANTDGRDTAFARAMIEQFSSQYCIDSERIFVTGMSYGGVATNDIGCEVGDLVRAIAPIAGAGPGFGNFGGGGPACVGQVASLLIHGTADTTVEFTSGQASRDHWLEANHCSADSPTRECVGGATCDVATATEYCDVYSGCDVGYPVHWCVHPGGHTIPDFSAQTIWDFFMQF
jgi:poly(3-hydroxybutyrate) depolymerase